MVSGAFASYVPRNPSSTVLYQIVTKYMDEFLGCYEEVFENRYGRLRPVVRKVLARFQDCGQYRCGFARLKCEACGAELILPFSCKTRSFCPSCQQRRVLDWAEWLTQHVLLDTGHRQVVWSLPRALRPLFLRDRKLLRELPGCAWRALKKYFEETLQDKAVPGMVVSVQTFSSTSLGWYRQS